MKSIVISAAALAAVGGAATGIAAIAPPGGVTQVQLAAVSAPRPQDPPAPNLPTRTSWPACAPR